MEVWMFNQLKHCQLRLHIRSNVRGGVCKVEGGRRVNDVKVIPS